VQILEYLDVAGDSPYRDWFESLDAQAAAKVTVALTRIELLAGGTKNRQQEDIATAQKRWADYKRRKTG
jgi:putative component of toxin-antitoxin plasmid stabilization module